MRIEQCQWSSLIGWKPQPPVNLSSAAQLVLVFGDVSTAAALECLETIGNFYPNAHVFGCSTAGEIRNGSA